MTSPKRDVQSTVFLVEVPNIEKHRQSDFIQAFSRGWQSQSVRLKEDVLFVFPEYSAQVESINSAIETKAPLLVRVTCIVNDGNKHEYRHLRLIFKHNFNHNIRKLINSWTDNTLLIFTCAEM
jgi:DNA mismatch repair ATPase MutS